MDLVVQSTSSEGGAVIAFLHFYRIVSIIFHKVNFQYRVGHKKRTPLKVIIKDDLSVNS